MLTVFATVGCKSGKEPYFIGSPIEMEMKNMSDRPLRSQLVNIDLASISNFESLFASENLALQLGDSLGYPFELEDQNNDGQADHMLLICDLEPIEIKKLRVGKSYVNQKSQILKSSTRAELAIKEGGQWIEKNAATGNFQYVYEGGKFSDTNTLQVPRQHRDHSNYIKFEGPGWESDKIGYRLYLDQRNAIDIFGKKTSEMVLSKVGSDDFESYHHMEDWGMDIFKVGKSLGIGSLGFWTGTHAQRVEKTDGVSCEVMNGSAMGSKVRISYDGWELENYKTDLIATLSIASKSRMTKHNILLESDLPNLCTGIIKNSNAEVILPKQMSTGWRYFATYGKQSLNNDNLGLFIVYRDSDIMEITEDEHSYVLVLMPKNKQLDYYFGAAWELEPGGIKTREAFISYLENLVVQLNAPVEVKYSKY